MQLPCGCFSISLGTLSHNGRCVCVLKQGSLRLPLSYHSLHWRCNMEQVTSHKHCRGNRASPNRTQVGVRGYGTYRAQRAPQTRSQLRTVLGQEFRPQEAVTPPGAVRGRKLSSCRLRAAGFRHWKQGSASQAERHLQLSQLAAS